MYASPSIGVVLVVTADKRKSNDEVLGQLVRVERMEQEEKLAVKYICR